MRGFTFLLTLLALALLTACGGEPAAAPERGPALWRIQRGDFSGYLFGTIHVLPDGVTWQTAAMREAMAGSDRLVLEAATLGDQTGTLAIFEKLGRSPGLPPIDERVPEQDRAALNGILAGAGTSPQALSGYESWAATMLLSAATQQALKVSEEHGVEPALTAVFKKAGKPLEGLETVDQQFAVFDTLPEDAQRRMLAQTVREAKDMRGLYDRILKAWLKGDVEAIAREDEGSEPPDPLVEAAVLTGRNRAWAAKIQAMRGHPFIAVGAGHLTGDDNLVGLLEQRGFAVTRVQ
jgi:uncharacterized protein YbaP (TraB family)